MSPVFSFDTTTVHSWEISQPDTSATVNFHRPYVAPPRLPHGLRKLDFGRGWNIRVQSAIDNIQKDSAVYHIITWLDTKLYSGILDSLNLAPANLDILCGGHSRNCLSDPKSPSDVRINFERPFVTPPKVVVFFGGFDLCQSKNWRLSTTATNIDKWGFTLNINTWGDTVPHYAQVGWIAYPEDREHIFSASVSTQDVRPYYKPQLTQSKDITFGDVEFLKCPDVFVAFNQFDIDCKAGFRLNAYVDNVSMKGLTWHIDTWHDTVLYSAAATIIAVHW
ncbi:hypothetical protein M378DRAFT_178313 [Amanita muscaria Koide BX008]|uniref:H-type lectin domain-containing protein n=1 Tax=Amanita muscaria (strain Koide BX008) TaxID=946122 RepID=A0A0C2WV36_AMAMK|nr:hypothetical protein M378DRAFT_178313 [Amanita muscaria Koide BX008]